MNQEPTAWSRSTFDVVAKCASRDPEVPAWAYPIIGRHALHPTIDKLLSKFAPNDWRQVLQQWPHVSMKDPSRLAYTPSEQYAARDRVLVTSPGKYVAKHWPNIPAHELRDLTLLTTTESSMYFVHTTPEMIIGVEYGPSSCMASNSPYCGHRFKHSDNGFGRLADWVLDNDNPEPDWLLHPYASYGPQDGWHMALRKEGSLIVARALCLTFKDRNYFVRSYRRSDDVGSSPTCETLNAWLMEQKYEFVGDWPNGARIDIGTDHDRAPYLDGGQQRANCIGSGIFLLDTRGDWVFDDTGGCCSDNSDDDDDDDYVTCDHCGNRFPSDDMTWVGRDEDSLVCERCLYRHYSLVRGEGRDYEYYVPDNDAYSVLGSDGKVDNGYPPDDVVWLDSVDSYAKRDDAVIIDGEWYLITDDDICQCKDDSEWRLREDCWQDSETGTWYSMEEPSVEQSNGELLHQNTIDAALRVNQLVLL